jgi:hypothetical protein
MMTRRITAVSERCWVCGSDDRPRHDELVANYVIHHRWSPNGDLVRAERPLPASPKQPRQQIMVVGAVDTTLRKILMDKGIISDQDFAALLDPGDSTDGDRGSGETPSP